MPGYEILEQKNLQPYKENGIKPYEIKIGFLDFLRELKTDAAAIPRNSSFIVVGIDEVLRMTKPEERSKRARKIHNMLQSAASILHGKNIQVQIICKERLVKGDSLKLFYRGEELPIHLIFGSTITNEVHGAHVYTIGFNLST